jgi:heme-degrading monooxygenase HmoA
MFARRVALRLKSHHLPELIRTMEDEIRPLLARQPGFQREVVLVSLKGTRVVAISLWRHPEDAAAYARDGYPEVVKILTRLLDAPPRVHDYNVAHFTAYEMGAALSA